MTTGSIVTGTAAGQAGASLPVVRIEDGVTDENSGRITFPVRLARASEETIFIPFRTGLPDDSARPGLDYRATEGVLEIAPGETESAIEIPLIASPETESSEFVSLVCGTPENATVLANHPLSTELPNPDGEIGTEFGVSVALSGNMALMGAPRPTDVNQRFTGKIYVFVQNEAGWKFLQRLEPPNNQTALFGTTLAVDGDVLVAGGAQQLVVYHLGAGGTWADSGIRIGSGQEGFQWFTGRLAIAPGADMIAAQARWGYGHRVLMFGLEDGVWNPRGALSGPDGDSFGEFGWIVQLTSSGALVRLPYDLSNPGPLISAYPRVVGQGTDEWSDNGTPLDGLAAFARMDGSLLVDGNVASASTLLRFHEISWTAPPTLTQVATTDAAPDDPTLRLRRMALKGDICAVTFEFPPDFANQSGYGVRVFYRHEGGTDKWGLVGDARKPSPIPTNSGDVLPEMAGNRIITGNQLANGGKGDAWITDWNVARGTIVDGAGPSIFVEPLEVVEPPDMQNPAEIEVAEILLSEPAFLPLALSWRTVPGSAEPGSDYVAASGVVQFLPGEFRKPVKVTLLPDNEREPAESFQLRFTASGPAMLLDSSAEIVIREDALPVRATIPGEVAVVEGDAGESALVSVRVELAEPLARPASISFEISQQGEQTTNTRATSSRLRE